MCIDVSHCCVDLCISTGGQGACSVLLFVCHAEEQAAVLQGQYPAREVATIAAVYDEPGRQCKLGVSVGREAARQSRRMQLKET